MERLADKYLRWVLEVDRKTQEYMVREEPQREMIRGRAGARAWGFKKRIEEGKGSEIASKC